MQRLQKVLARAGVASRRKSEELILAGRVKVNGIVIKELGYKVSSKDKILFDDKPIFKEDYVYFLLNKPKKYVSTTSDEKGRKTVLDLIDLEDKKDKRLYPIGRLDYDSQGLILITNDGDLTYKLTHPKHEVEKEYNVRIDGILSKNEIAKIIRGIKLDNNLILKAKKVEVLEIDKKLNTSLVKVILTEGKNRQIRKIFKKLNYNVSTLTRIRYAFLTIDKVGRGFYRPLKTHEIKKLKNL